MSSYFQAIYDRFEALPDYAKYAIGAATLAVPAYLLLSKKKPRPSPLKTDWKEGIVYVYQFPRSPAIPSISPFCLKVETWLRIADIPYENVECDFWSVRSKEGMLPFVEFNGIEYADSSLLIRDLSKLLKKEDIMMSEQKGAARAFEQMVDNVTFLSYAYVRYIEKTDEMFSEKILGTNIPLMLRLYPQFLFKNAIKNKMYHHGLGRHSRDEIVNIGLDDLRALSYYLGTKQYMMGDRPSRVDATVFGALANIVFLPLETPHKRFIDTECQNLKAYCDRMKLKFWPDWEEACKTGSMHTKWKTH